MLCPKSKTRKMLAFRHHPKECASENLKELSGIAKILTQACTLIELDTFSACNRAQITAPEKPLCSFSSNMYIQLQSSLQTTSTAQMPFKAAQLVFQYTKRSLGEIIWSFPF
jgi:hypothetical protein